LLFKVSPYAKAVVTAIAALVAVVANAIVDGNVSYDDLAAAIGGVAAVYAVWRVPNKPTPEVSSNEQTTLEGE